MPTPDVIEKVRQLRAELATARPASPEAEHLTKQLDTVLVEPDHAPHYAGLGDRLRSAAAGLEAEHPQLAAAMTTVVNALNAAGV
jgi:hypothetical protein